MGNFCHFLNMATPVLIILAVGIFFRLSLFGTSIAEWFAGRNEVTTPLTSWNRVVEGLSLYKAGVSPYSGDIFHQMPLMLRFLNWLGNTTGPSIYWIFLIIDVLNALLLESVARRFSQYMLREQARNVKNYSPDSKELIVKGSDLVYTRLYVVAAYLLNPYTIVTCVTKSTAVFDNFFITLAIYFTLRENKNRACLCIAIAAYMSLYPIMLIVPAAIHLARESVGADKLLTSRGVSAMLTTGVTTLLMLAGLLYVSFMVQGSWTFLYSTYGFILSVPDLTPNMGVFWYFFTEMFEHFRTFFICVFQINAFIYTVPLAVKLRDHPIFLMQVLVALIAIFKSYPCYGDTVIYLALLPLWRHSFPYMRNNFVVACMFVVCSVLAPILYHLWIYSGSANANFYFAITLVYSTAQIFLITDLLFGYLRREYALEMGPKPKLENGEVAQVTLD